MALFGGARLRSSGAAFAGAAFAGLAGAALWAIDAPQWLLFVLAVPCRLAVFPSARRETLALMSTIAVPVLLLVLALASGSGDATRVLVRSLRDAVPSYGLSLRAVEFLALACLLGSGVDRDRDRALPRPRFLATAFGAAFIAALAWCLIERGVSTFRAVRLPTDLRQWSEPPLLLDVLKRRAGAPVYGSPFDVNSFTYSAVLPLLHAAVLSLFGLDLDIVAHRALVLAWQAATVGVLVWGLWPRFPSERRASLLVTGAVGAASLLVLWSSPASPHLHPDHAVHLFVASATAVLSREPSLPRPVVRASIVLLPALAAAFKMTGAGILVGFALVFLVHDRRKSAVLPVAVGAFAVFLTIPLLEALLPGYETWTLSLMRRHDVAPSQALRAFDWAGCRLVVVALALGLFQRVAGTAARGSDVLRLSLFAAGVLSTSLVAFAKDGGLPNNFTAPAIPAVAALFVWVLGRPRREAFTEDPGEVGRTSGIVTARRPAGMLVAALAACVAALVPSRPVTADALRLAERDHAASVAFVRGELRASRRPLVSSLATWIDAGATSIPVDLLHSFWELYMARDPACEAHLGRLRAGTYSALVLPAGAFSATTIHGDRFGERYLRTIEERYCLVYPEGLDGKPTAPRVRAATDRILLFRRQDTGCEPFARANGT